MVYADSDSLINFLINNNVENVDHPNEMMKCINTMMFVINHMYNELKNKLFYSKNKNVNELHINNNYTEKNRTSTRFESLNDQRNDQRNNKQNNLFKNDGKKKYKNPYKD
jgi:hypothetical protein